MKTALFTNFSREPFTGYWNGKGRTYEAGKGEYMPDYLAQHFAKHLVNRELLRKDEKGQPIYKDGEKFTSPKYLYSEKEEERKNIPALFLELYNKAYTPDETDALGDQKDDIDTLIKSAQKNRNEKINGKPETVETKSETTELKNEIDPSKNTKQDPKEPQYIEVPPSDDDEEFEGTPIEGSRPNN